VELLEPLMNPDECRLAFEGIVDGHIIAPTPLMVKLGSRCPPASAGEMLKCAVSACRMDAVNALLSSHMVSSSRVIRMLYRLRRWHLIAPIVEKFGCETGIRGDVILAAADHGKWGHVDILLPFLAEAERDPGLLLYRLLERGWPTATVLKVCKIDWVRNNSTTVRRLVDSTGIQGDRAKMRLLYPNCCKRCVVEGAARGIGAGVVSWGACLWCLAFAMDEALDNGDFMLAKQLCQQPDFTFHFRKIRYAKKLVGIGCYRDALGVVDAYGLGSRAYSEVQALIPDGDPLKRELARNYQADLSNDSVVDIAASEAEWDVVVENMSTETRPATIQRILLAVFSLGCYDVADRIAYKHSVAIRAGTRRMLAKVGEALGDDAGVQRVLERLKKRKRSDSAASSGRLTKGVFVRVESDDDLPYDEEGVLDRESF